MKRVVYLVILIFLAGCTSIDITPDNSVISSHVEFNQPRTENEMAQTITNASNGIQQIYKKFLRKKPFAKGLVTFEYQVATNGMVSSCEITQTTLHEPKLEIKLRNYFCSINFGAKNANLEYDETTTFNLNLIPD